MSSNQTTNQIPTSYISRWWYQKATDSDMASIEDRIINMKMERAKETTLKMGKNSKKAENNPQSVRQKLQEAKKLLNLIIEDYEHIKQKCIANVTA